MLYGWLRRKEVKSSSLEPIDMPGRKVGVQEFMFGDVLTQVWANPAPGGVFLRVTIRKVVKRTPRDEFATGFQLGDLLDVACGANRVLRWLEDNQEQVSLLTPDPSYKEVLERFWNSRR
jgi:hypothetical protein